MEHHASIAKAPHALIIAEAGVNHNGRLDLALQLCDAARDAGADVVKFQTWKTGTLMAREAKLADYQKYGNPAFQSQYGMAEALELPYDDFRKIAAHCRQIGIRFLSTPDEAESLDFLVDEMHMEVIKVGSGEVTNIPFLMRAGSKGKEVILSTGMSDLQQVQTAFDTLRQSGAGKISLLQCTSQYPAPFGEVNLRAMQTLREHFGVDVGLSDHTEGIEVAIAAVALGAQIIEKHLTLDRSMQGPDHRASIAPETFRLMVGSIRNVEQAMGDGFKQVQPSERAISEVVRKRLLAGRAIAKGEMFSLENVVAKRAASGAEASRWLEIEGKAAPRDYSPEEPIDL